MELTERALIPGAGIFDVARREFDKTSLPDEVILSSYFSVRDGKIVSLVVIFNQAAGY